MDNPPTWDGGWPLFVSLCFVAFPLVLRHLRLRAFKRTVRPVRPLDLTGFHTLMDRDSEEFLRERLPRAEFFRIKRRRIKVLWKYVRRIAQNAAAGMRCVAGSRHDPDVNVARVAREVANLASQIRMQCLLAFAKLTVEYIFPALRLRKYRSWKRTSFVRR